MSIVRDHSSISKQGEVSSSTQRRRWIRASALGAALLGASLVACGGTSDGTGSTSNAVGADGTNVNANATVDLCGSVDAYAAASSDGAGSLSLSGTHYGILAGGHIANDAVLQASAHVCVRANLDVSGSIHDGEARLVAQAQVSACGRVRAYAAASGTADGELDLSDKKLHLSTGCHLAHSEMLNVGADVCVGANVDATGDVTDGTVSAEAMAHAHVCGQVSAYVAASANGNGSLDIGGKHFSLVSGCGLSNDAVLQVNASACVDLDINVTGDVEGGSCSAGTGGGDTGGSGSGGGTTGGTTGGSGGGSGSTGGTGGGSTGGSGGGSTGGSTGCDGGTSTGGGSGSGCDCNGGSLDVNVGVTATTSASASVDPTL